MNPLGKALCSVSECTVHKYKSTSFVLSQTKYKPLDFSRKVFQPKGKGSWILRVSLYSLHLSVNYSVFFFFFLDKHKNGTAIAILYVQSKILERLRCT